MSDVYHLDFETYSEAKLPKVGAFKYAEHSSTEILIMAIAKNDGPVEVWDFVDGGAVAYCLLQEAIASGEQIYAHNAQFEHAVCKYQLKKTFPLLDPPDIKQWRCTAAMCRLAAIPSSLDKAGEFLGIKTPKDKEGKRLIRLFSVQRKPTIKHPYPRLFPHHEPEDFAKFIAYCAQDVIAERQIHHKLERDFLLKGWALESFKLDLTMNDRGIPINRCALEHANELMEEYLSMKVPEFQEQTTVVEGWQNLPVTKMRPLGRQVSLNEGFRPSQREMFMVFLQERGFTGADLTSTTVEEWLEKEESLTEEAHAALTIYYQISSAAVKKIPTMLNMACEDGYIRGSLMVFGAERTHRWTGRGVQPQNFARPVINFTGLAYDMLCNEECIEDIEATCGDFFDILVSVIRHFIQPHDGNCLQADYSSIEARVAPWLVDEQATLDLFERGEPVYEIMAQKIFGGGVADITPDQRFIGKQAVLGCTYNMGAPKFRGTCESYGFSPSLEMVEEFKSRTPPKPVSPTQEEWEDAAYDDLAQRAVTTWRAANPITTASWRLLDTAAKNAINTPSSVHVVGKLKVTFRTVGGFKALLIKLPSGHLLVYPKASIHLNGKFGPEIEFYGIIPNSGGRWGTCSTHGGKLFENCSQATAGDVMRHGMKCAEDADYKAFMLVHDEILTLQDNPSQTHEELCDLLCQKADWMHGLPLAAEGGTLPYYKK